MSALITIEQTPTGWRVVVNEAEQAVVETSGKGISVSVDPDDGQASRPLAVSIAQP